MDEATEVSRYRPRDSWSDYRDQSSVFCITVVQTHANYIYACTTLNSLMCLRALVNICAEDATRLMYMMCEAYRMSCSYLATVHVAHVVIPTVMRVAVIVVHVCMSACIDLWSALRGAWPVLKSLPNSQQQWQPCKLQSPERGRYR
jgi:hypothetical protein